LVSSLRMVGVVDQQTEAGVGGEDSSPNIDPLPRLLVEVRSGG